MRGNDFEVDVEVRLPAELKEEWPLVDYARISEIVHTVLKGETVPLLEMLVRDVYERLQEEWPFLGYIRVAIRKMRPPMEGNIGWAQVSFEG